MENRTNQSGAQSRNRSRNRNRNQNRNGGGGGENRNNRQSGSNSNRDRNKDRNRKPKIVELTMGQKILKAITFGAIDPNKKKIFPKSTRVQSVDTAESSERQSARKFDSEAREKPQRSGREPKVFEVTSSRLYVGNLDYNAAESDLEGLFRGVGNVVSTEVVTNSRTQQSKGFAFVEMGSVEEARRAVEVLHDQDFMGRKLLVSGAKSEGPRGDEA
jgi:RNA recognition motif. (a.k.a. RRM, RBD, or RNP domain)